MRLRTTVLVLLAVLAAAAPARAATFTVSGLSDGTGSCDGNTCTTLRAALAAASKATGPDLIELPVPTTRGATYRVTAGSQLTIDSEVTITSAGTGASAATVGIQGDGKSSRIFDVTTTAKVTIAHLTISNGAAPSSDGGVGGNIRLDQGGNLTLDHVRVTGGTALRGAGIGMGPASTLTITQSLIDHNTASSPTGGGGDGGALLSVGNAKLAANALHISDSTIAQNSASQAAGIELTSNAANQTTLDRVTIAFNSGSTNALGNGVSANDAESIKIGSSIIAGNTGDGVPTNCDHKLTSTGGNIDTGTSCGFAAPGDRPSTDPQLSTILGMAGGETPVLSIPATSPAVDFAPACTGEDQRDLARPQGKSCDSGAFEVDQAPQTTITNGPKPLDNSTTASFTFTSSDPGSTFECNLDSAGFAPCSPPQTYTNLSQGAHTLSVRATDPGGNTDQSPATRNWTIDSIAPDTALTPITSPTKDNTPTFNFSSEAGATFECKVDTGAYATCTSPFTTATLADGSHTFSVRATDAAGNTDPTPATQTFTVNTLAPTVTFLSAPTGPTNDTTPTLTFSSSDPNASFACRFDGADFAGCASPFTPATPLTEGEHTFDVQATDAAGNVGSASRLVVIDLTPPPPPTVESGPSGVTTDDSPSFTFAPSAGAAAVECSLTGPGQSGAFSTCASPASFSGLGPGAYTFTVRARDAAGNTTTSSRSFTVAVPQQSTPTPTPTPTPPEPVFHQTVVVQPAGGKVLVRRKGSKTFVPLDATQGIPLGSEVNAKHGKVELTSVPKNGGKPQTALFYGGIFVVTQTGRITQLRLSEKLAACRSAKASIAAAKKKKPKTRSLWGDGHGSFRTKGQYSAATVRGTKWNVRDSCAGTLTRVARGVIAVQDFVKHRTKILRAGQRYLAKPSKRG